MALVGLVAAAPAPATAQVAAGGVDSLSVAECGELARHMAPSVAVAGADLRAARFDSLAAARNRRPAFSLIGGAMVAPEGFYDPALTDLGQYELKVGVEWNLLDGGSRQRARRRAANQARLAGTAFEQTAREAAVRAAWLAVEILRLRDSERVQGQSLDWLDQLEAYLESAVRAGTRGVSDKLRSDLERDAAQVAHESAHLDLETASRELAQMLGRDAATFAVREPRPGEDRGPSEDDSLRLCVQVDRLAELRMARTQQEQASLEVEEARRRSALQLGAAADAGLWGSDLTRWIPPDVEGHGGAATFGDRLVRDAGATATVTARLPVADATAGPNLEARRAQAEAATLRLGAEGATQRRLGFDLIARWRVAANRAAAAGDLARLAGANLMRVKSLYVAGAATLLELLDARKVFDDSHGRWIDARSTAREAQYEAESRR